MSSNDRLTVDVDRLDRTDRPDEYKQAGRLFRSVVGPNGDGEATADILIPETESAIGVRAYVGAEPGACPGYPSTDGSRDEPTGCAIIDLDAAR